MLHQGKITIKRLPFWKQVNPSILLNPGLQTMINLTDYTNKSDADFNEWTFMNLPSWASVNGHVITLNTPQDFDSEINFEVGYDNRPSNIFSAYIRTGIVNVSVNPNPISHDGGVVRITVGGTVSVRVWLVVASDNRVASIATPTPDNPLTMAATNTPGHTYFHDLSNGTYRYSFSAFPHLDPLILRIHYLDDNDEVVLYNI